MKKQMKLLVALFILMSYSLQLHAQQKQITETITGKSLSGVHLMIKDSIMITITNFDKKFLYLKKTVTKQKRVFLDV